MNKYIIIIFLLITTNLMAQQPMVFTTIVDPKDQTTNMLVGQLSIKNIVEDPTCAWFTKGYKAYIPDSNVLNLLQPTFNNYSFVIAAGTWCEDTQNLLPQLYKVLDSLHYNTSSIELLGMDRNKQALNIEHQLLKIEKLPTIIIRKGNREVYRIVETLNKATIEKELLYQIENDKSNWKE